MKLYRKNPVDNEAMQYDGTNGMAMSTWSQGKILGDPDTRNGITVETNRGTMEVNIGDWVVRGAPDDFYPIEDSIFTTLYAPTEIPAGRSLDFNSSKGMIDSESDARTDNNTMRHQYKTLSDSEKGDMLSIKDIGAAFIIQCDTIGSSRELSLAKTKAEEAVFWAVKSITA